jgi:CDP-4-dehydro-6-deoxyglucose reductase, E1
VSLDWPLMKNNIQREDLDSIISYLKQEDPILTQSSQVRAFEEEWSDWLGVKYSVFVNSGSSANLLSMCVLREQCGSGGEVIVPTLTWVSDIASVIQCGFEPVFVDIDPKTLGMDNVQIIDKITPQTKAVFLTHILGYNALSQTLLDELAERGIPLIEDVCESHGAEFGGQKLGTWGWMSNFSFYYAHHMSTIEGGMISTNDELVYQQLRMMRAHGMVRESTSDDIKNDYHQRFSDLNPDFIFAFPAYNVRGTEIQAIMGRSQLKSLDTRNKKRREHLELFLNGLDANKFRTDFNTVGSCNYAFTLVLKNADPVFCKKVVETLREQGVEHRRGTSGGGNQLRQPYLEEYAKHTDLALFSQVDHIHFYGFYIGNYPDLEKEKIMLLCDILNRV